MYNIFIDGREGTTGLRIFERLAERKDINMIILPDEERKDAARRADAINSCDLAFLCLPDAAAKESVSFIKNDRVKVLDTSTAHRTASDWAYGFPELSPAHRQAVITSNRVSVPGCHASGFISLVYPLVSKEVIYPDTHLVCHSLTGYSGGGKKMIAQYEGIERDTLLDAPREYGLPQQHKHLPEMVARTGLTFEPIFSPIVADYYSGMLVSVSLFADRLPNGVTAQTIAETLRSHYAKAEGGRIEYIEPDVFAPGGFASSCSMSGSDNMQVTVTGNDQRIVLMSRFDNLGKGASGAALQCMELMLGCE